MTIAPGQRIVATADSAGRLVAIPVNSPTPGQRVVSIAASTGKLVAIPVTSPTPGSRIMATSSITGRSVAILAGKYVPPTPPVPTPWSARYGFGCVITPSNVIYVLGCYNSAVADVWTDSGTGCVSWTRCTASTPAVQIGTYFFGAAYSKSAAKIVTGAGWANSAIPDVQGSSWASSDGITWTEQTSAPGWGIGSTPPGGARSFAGIVALSDGSVLVMGGTPYWGSGYPILNDVWSDSGSAGASWTEIANPAGWSAREFPCAVALGSGKVLVMAGYNGSYLNDVWLSSGGISWSPQTYSAGWSGRRMPGVVMLPNGHVVLLGGYNGSSYFTDVWNDSGSNGATWTEKTASAPWSAREGMGLVATSTGTLYMMGGKGSGGNLNDVWKSTDEGATWVLL